MLYRTTAAILFKGDRVPRGTEIEMDENEAARLGGYVVPVDDVAVDAPEEEVEEKALEDMSKDELVEAAKAAGVETGGTKADLLERITLARAGGADDQPEEEVEEN